MFEPDCECVHRYEFIVFLDRYASSGTIFGVVICFIIALMYFQRCFWDWLYPESLIEKCPAVVIGEVRRESDVGRMSRFNYSS